MPARSSRHNHARNNKQNSNVPSPRPSPPTQLPTPLPEEERITVMHRAVAEIADHHLIDFDTPTPPQQLIRLPPAETTLDINPLKLEDEDDDILTHTYRSPPFREAHLPDLEPDKDHSPPPLPIPPRGPAYQQEEVYHDGVDSSITSNSGGHTRWPTYSRYDSLLNRSQVRFMIDEPHVLRLSTTFKGILSSLSLLNVFRPISYFSFN